MVHALNVQDGSDLAPPVKFLPPDANVSGLILIDRVLYAATANNCGGVANGMWAIDLASPDKTVTTWKSNGGGSAGTVGPAFGSDGLIYLATADGDYSAANYSDAVVALQPKTLALKDYFTPGKMAFDSSPVVFPYNGKDLVAAAGKQGRLYLLDSSSLGGPDHHTPTRRHRPALQQHHRFLRRRPGHLGRRRQYALAACARFRTDDLRCQLPEPRMAR